jgi:hypothetical protein
MFGNRRTNSSQLGAPRASLVRPDHRRVIFGKHLNPPAQLRYARLHLHAGLSFAHVRSRCTGVRRPFTAKGEKCSDPGDARHRLGRDARELPSGGRRFRARRRAGRKPPGRGGRRPHPGTSPRTPPRERNRDVSRVTAPVPRPVDSPVGTVPCQQVDGRARGYGAGSRAPAAWGTGSSGTARASPVRRGRHGSGGTARRGGWRYATSGAVRAPRAVPLRPYGAGARRGCDSSRGRGLPRDGTRHAPTPRRTAVQPTDE